MSPDRAIDQTFELLDTPNPAEVAFRIAVGKHNLRVADLPAEGDAYKSLRCQADKPRVDEFGDYVMTKREDGPPGYFFFFFGQDKTDAEKRTPWKTHDGDGQTYEWPRVVRGILFAEDTDFPVEVRTGVNLTTEQPRLRARLNETERTFAHCRTVLKYYQAPTEFKVPARVQPATSRLRWVINGDEDEADCLHPTLTLPAAGSRWSVRYNAGASLPGVPSAQRTFPATPMQDWQPFVIRSTHRQHPSGVWEYIEEWIIPPNRPQPPTP